MNQDNLHYKAHENSLNQAYAADRPLFLIYGARDPGLWSAWKGVAECVFPSGADVQPTVAKLTGEGKRIDACIMMVPEFTCCDIPKDLLESPIPTVACVLDRNNFAYNFYAKLFLFDLIITADHESVAIFRAMGHPNVVYAPLCGFAPQIIRPIEADEIYDVTFFGGLGYGNKLPGYHIRDKTAHMLTLWRNDFRIRLATYQSINDTIAFGPNYIKALNQTKIGIFVVATDNRHLNPTLLEIMASGKLAFAHHTDEIAQQHFIDHEDLVFYHEDNLHDLLKYYLDNPKERLRVSQNGLKAVQSFNYLNQFKHIKQVLMPHIRSVTRPLAEGSEPDRSLAEAVGLFHCLNNFPRAASIWTRYPSDPVSQNNLGVFTCVIYLKDPNQTHAKSIFECFNHALALDQNWLWPLFNRFLARSQIIKESAIDDAHLLLKWLSEDHRSIWKPHSLMVNPFVFEAAHSSLIASTFGYAICNIKGIADEIQLIRMVRWLALKHIATETSSRIHYRLAIETMEHDAALYMGLAQLMFNEKNIQEALDWLDKGLYFCPFHPDLTLLKVHYLIEAKRHDQAKEFIQAVLFAKVVSGDALMEINKIDLSI